MASKDIVGLLTLTDRDGNVVHQVSNVSFRYASKYRTIYRWNNNYSGQAPVIYALPWKNAFLLQDDDINIGHDVWGRGAAGYPADPTGSNVFMNTVQYNFFRNSGTVGTVGTANIPRVFGGVAGASLYPGTVVGLFGRGDCVISQVDLPLDYTQIGIVYAHPAHQQANTIATTAGLSYVTYTNNQFWDQIYVQPGVFSILRIETGADAGFYFITNNNYQNDRLYLRCLDGRPFKAIATASGLLATAGPGRRAWFNEVSVIPLSVGTMETGGRFNPRNPASPYFGDAQIRDSWIMRVVLEKTGSTEVASGTEQQGSYLVSMRPYTHGDGALTSSVPDQRGGGDDYLYGLNGNESLAPWWSNFGGGVNGSALDWDNQRLWFGMTNAANQSSIYHWRYKTTETFREVANYLGTAGSASFLTPTPVLGAGDVITDIEMGSNTGSAKNWVYVTVYHASGGNAGVIIIKPDLTTLQYNTGSGVPSSVLAGCLLDKSRTRTGSAGDVSTNGSDQVTSASGAFTDADISRVIKLTGLGADSGTYKIATRVSATQVTVTTLAGGAVTFTSQSGGTFEIGDRHYYFFGNNTTGAGKINYMESMAPGTFLTRTVTMTNGANINTRVTGGTGHVYGQRELCAIDKANGNIYWLSNDTQQQINKYDPTTNTHSFIAISNATLLSPTGGVVVGAANPATNPGSPTAFTAITVNSKFDDIWVGSDAGIFRIVKSTFAAATIKRYYGTDSTTYYQGVPLTTGTGNGTTGLSFSTPNVTLNATGTPFTANDVGKYVVITGASTAANNGFFPITAFNSSSQIVFTNASGATQANYAGTFYIVSDIRQHSDGCYGLSGGQTRYTRSLWEAPDGRMIGYQRANGTANGNLTWFSQEADNWSYRGDINPQNTNEAVWYHWDPWGRYFYIHPSTGGSSTRYLIGPYEMEMQWDDANQKWIPLEWVRTSMPNKSLSDNTNPFCKTRPIHSTFQDVMFGVKVRFNRQGGATPPNNEFLGRGGQSRTTSTDGSTTSGSSTFGGSSFVSGDVGKLLRIESGADANIYKITAFINAASVTLQRMDGSSFSATATAGTLTYTLWDLGTPGSNAGPENITVLLADGIGKDNTQDLTGMSYEYFGWKTRFHEQDEQRKFCVENPSAVPGSTETKVYYETYARATPQYDAALSHHRALPGAEHTNGRQLLDWMMDKHLNNAGGRADMNSSPGNAADWHGVVANSGVMGASAMVDLGKDVEVGFIQIRARNLNSAAYAYVQLTLGFHGMIANLYNAANSGGTPVASSSVRTSGTTNMNVSGANVTTVTVSSGDLLGSITTGPNSDGAITSGGNTFVAPASTFVTSDLMKVLKITAGAGADIGSYRIIAVSGDGSTVTIRNLDQTAKLWNTSASGITYEVRDGVREEDMIAIPSLAGATHKLCVERLLSATSFQARTAANATVTDQSWQCIRPSWSPVKRLSYSTEAQPPDVKNNLTWMSNNGRMQYYNGDFVMYFDLTDLPAAQRTARWWKWTGIPRFAGDSGQDASFNFSTFEFYDISGNKLAVSKYNLNDQALTNSDHFFSYLNRIDFIQGANDAMSGVAGFNGNAGLGGANGDTITATTGGNKFLGFQVRVPYTDGNLPSGTNQVNSASAVWTTTDVGRIIRITSGANAGNFYRIATRVSATQVTVTTPSGGAVSWGATESSINFTVHSGFNVEGTTPDRFVFRRMGAAGDVTTTVSTSQLNSATGAFTLADIGKTIRVFGATGDNGSYIIKTVPSATQVTVTDMFGAAVSFTGGSGGTFEIDLDAKEFTLLTISNDLQTLTISETLQPSLTNRPWEIRRPGYDTTSTTTDSTKTARITRPMSTYPVQSGDVCQDRSGHFRFFAEDIGSGYQRTDGVIAGGSGAFTGSGFCSDDVGRLLYIDTGVNKGIYEISVFTSATAITVKNHYTGAAVSFTADAGPVTYRIFGDRRFRLAKYVTGLRA